MKRFLVVLLYFAISQQAFAQSGYKYLGSYNAQGVPTYFAGRDNLTSDFLKRVNASLPERYPVPYYNPQYIANGTQTNIVLNEAADVWVTFVSEGAGYMNVLGFYTYDANNPSTNMPADKDITIIFPNVSAAGSGGGLVAGDKVKIGTFQKGTGIGWVLLANAWTGSAVGNALWKLYSNPAFNPENNASLKYHNVLLYDMQTERIVLGFEDIKRDLSSCDNDFNDAIFYVTANPITAISLNNMNVTNEVGSDISSGNDGGLESNGSLAEKIAKRNIKKDLLEKNQNRNLASSMKTFAPSKKMLSSAGIPTLDNYFPLIGNDSALAYISTPTDLLGITNAIEVLSVDYFKDNNRTAVALATRTDTEVYSHTKSICDRVGGASLEAVKQVYVLGKYPANFITLKKNDIIEYAISFSMRNSDVNTYEFNSHWNVEDYPSGKPYLNFQLWGKTPMDVFFLVEQILAHIGDKHVLTDSSKFTAAPIILMKSGQYEQGKFKMKILNPTKNTGILKVVGTTRSSEQLSSVIYSENIALAGTAIQDITLNTKGVFDAGLILQEVSQPVHDNIYLADGAWIANYEPENVRNTNLKIIPQDALPSNSTRYWVERGVEASGEVKNYYSIHRPLRLGLSPVDLRAFNYLSFTASGNVSIEVVVSREGITDWLQQPRIYVMPTEKPKEYYIDLNRMISGMGLGFDKSDVTAITFSIIGDNTQFSPFNVELNQVAFSETGGCERNKEVVATAYSAEKYESEGIMKVQNKNKTQSNVVLTSSNAIEFLPGFVAETGAVLSAEVKGCENIGF